MSTSGLPEHTDYPDEGCTYFPSCLACPLPVCRHDLGRKGASVYVRQAAIAVLQAQGLSNAQIATRLGLSKRQVQRLKVQRVRLPVMEVGV